MEQVLYLCGAHSGFGDDADSLSVDDFHITEEQEPDAAYVDGCKPLGVFFKIFLPLAGPPVSALCVLTVAGSWNSFMWPLILISDKNKQMLSVGLLQFTGQYSTDTHLMMAAATLTLLPLMILYMFMQRYFIEGIAFSGVKG